MTLKAIKQLTNIAWIIGGVSAATAGYSYINSKREQVFVDYTRKTLGTISSVEDIEDYEKQKGCLFLFFTKQERTPNKPTGTDPIDHGDRVTRPSLARTSGSASVASLTKTSEPALPSPAPEASPVQNYSSAPKYNEWNNGGVLSARNYIDKNKQKKEKVIKRAEAMRNKCERGKIIYEEIDDSKTPPDPQLPN